VNGDSPLISGANEKGGSYGREMILKISEVPLLNEHTQEHLPFFYCHPNKSENATLMK
jgi:hypothetical protein